MVFETSAVLKIETHTSFIPDHGVSVLCYSIGHAAERPVVQDVRDLGCTENKQA